MVLRATAGLRLLTDEQAEGILNEVRRFFFFFPSALRHFGPNTSRPTRDQDEKTTKCLQVSQNEKAASRPIWRLSCCKRTAVVGFVWSNHIQHLKYYPGCCSSLVCGQVICHSAANGLLFRAKSEPNSPLKLVSKSGSPSHRYERSLRNPLSMCRATVSPS